MACDERFRSNDAWSADEPMSTPKSPCTPQAVGRAVAQKAPGAVTSPTTSLPDDFEVRTRRDRFDETYWKRTSLVAPASPARAIFKLRSGRVCTPAGSAIEHRTVPSASPCKSAGIGFCVMVIDTPFGKGLHV